MTAAALCASRKLRPVAWKRLTNIAHLLSGNFTNAGIMLISVAIAARALGPAEYGIMVLVLAFGRTIERLIRFESWQPLIRFLAVEGDGENKERVAQLYAFGLALDIVAACAAGLITSSLAFILGPAIGIDPKYVDLVAIYSVALFLNITGMPTAVLRMAGRFRTIAYAQLVPNLLRVLLAAICLWQGAGLYGFVLAWTVAQIAGALLFLVLSFGILRRQGVRNPLLVPLRGARGRFPGFLSFAWSTNLSTMLRTITGEADALLVGMLAGPGAAGFYHIAKRIARVAHQVSAQVQTVIYPDVARMWHRGEIALFRTTTLQVQLALAAVGLTLTLAMWVLGKWAIMLGPGPLYLAAFPLLMTQMVAVILLMHAAPSRSALLAMGRARTVLLIAAVGTLVFAATALIAIPRLGAMGANVAHIALGLVTALLMDAAWLRGTRRPADAAARRIPDNPPGTGGDVDLIAG